MTKPLLAILLLLPFWLCTPAHGTDFCFSANECIPDTAEDDLENVRAFEISGLRIYAMDISKERECQRVISMFGIIGPDSTYFLEKLISEDCQDSFTFVLNSSGGLLNDGFSLGEMVSKVNAQVWIARDADCASACVIAFLHARDRGVQDGGTLSFHAPYIYNGDEPQCDKSSRRLKKLFTDQLGDDSGGFAYSRMFSFCGPNELWTINGETMKLLGIVDKVGGGA